MIQQFYSVISKKNKTYFCTNTYVHSSIIYNSQQVDMTRMSIAGE